MKNTAETYTKMICALSVATEAHKKIFSLILEPNGGAITVSEPYARYMAALTYASGLKQELMSNGGMKFSRDGLPQELRDPVVQQRLAQEAHQEMQPLVDKMMASFHEAAVRAGLSAPDNTWVSRIASPKGRSHLESNIAQHTP